MTRAGIWWMALVVASTPLWLAAQPAPPRLADMVKGVPADEPATLTYANRTITTLRADVLGRSPSARAAGIIPVLDELAANGTVGRVTFHTVEGVAIVSVDGRQAFSLVPADVDPLVGETLDAKASGAAANLEVALREATELRGPRQFAIALAQALAVTLLFVLAIAAVHRTRWTVTRRLVAATHHRLRRLPGATIEILPTERLIAIVRGFVRGTALVVSALLTYWWLTFVLRRFPYTRPLGESLRQMLLSQLSTLALRVIDALPGLFMVVIIVLITRFAVKASNHFFDAVSEGRIAASKVYVDTALPTKRLVAALLWLFALIEAYPFIPGSDSDAFKGISVFIGLVVSLGSTGIVNQMISSLTLTYTRALRPGDYVRIGQVEGTVTQVGVLSTKIKTPRREEVTIPNAVVLADTTTNYTHFNQHDGVFIPTSVTIGYDAPWRQVQALLMLAAERTSGIRRDPPPLVLQSALEDFYVRYTLLISLHRPDRRAIVLNTLHANIQDAFNEYGVQIMSPNYEADPDAPKLVPKSHWFAAPAPAGDGRGSAPRSQAGVLGR